MKSFILKCKMELESYWKKLYFSKEQKQQFYNKYNFIDFEESNINSIESEGESNANDENSRDDDNKIEEIISTIDINKNSCISDTNNNQSVSDNQQNKNSQEKIIKKKKSYLKSKNYSDEEILAAYEKEIVRMEKLYDEAKDVLELVGKHIKLVEEVKNFEV